MEKLLYGAAYYDEYMPYERLDKDIEMFKKAGINVIRIAESTWATEEPSEGVFNFSHITRVLDATSKAGISVIIGTPTYAIPAWMALKYPEVIVTTKNGKDKYGRRQNMDITHPTYLFFAQRIIRKLMEVVSAYDNVIGFQLDNETKHYDTCSPNVHKQFVEYLKQKFVTIEALNKEFGFNYWSNRIDCFENVPSTTGSINASFSAEFAKFQRTLVDNFLNWQSDIVKEYLKEGQFITHNFDFEWRGFSYGVQADVDHKKAAKALTLAGCDIYHESQNKLTGKEIAFSGDITRNLLNNNYLVLETLAQGQTHWLPYNGQIRLQAFSHVASGANAVMYWHWHSIHNACETYWKGILSHDMQENRIYGEVSTVGSDFARLSPKLVNLKKENKVAVLVSNDSLTALDEFRTPDGKMRYNDFFRYVYDNLYEMNVETDILFPEDYENFEKYKMIVVPTLYSASDKLLESLNNYCKNGGILVSTFKTGFSNEYLTVSHEVQPRKLSDCFGVHYNEYTLPVDMNLTADDFVLDENDRKASVWMELLETSTANTISYYDNESFGKYSAVTENSYGKGKAYYIGCFTTDNYLKKLYEKILKDNGIWSLEQEVNFPIIIKKAKNGFGKDIVFYFNYLGKTQNVKHIYQKGTELISGFDCTENEILEIKPWGFKIIEID